MEHRLGTETRWSKWGSLLFLAAVVGCGADWQRATEELGRAGNGGEPPGRESADARADAAESLDASKSADAKESNDATPSSDSGGAQSACVEDGGTMCGTAGCCLANFVCINGNTCSPACDHAYPLCGGRCCPLHTSCMNDVCNVLCQGANVPANAGPNAGECPDGGLCTLGTSCEVVPSNPPL
jgi:hypothetical protein